MNIFGHDPNSTWVVDIETDGLTAKWDPSVRDYLHGYMNIATGEYLIGTPDTVVPPAGDVFVFHNASFDVAAMRIRGRTVANYFCTMVASHTLNPSSADQHSLGTLVPEVKRSLKELLIASGYDMSKVRNGTEYTWYGKGDATVDHIVEEYLLKDLTATRQLYLWLVDQYSTVPERTLGLMLSINQPYIERIIEMERGMAVSVDARLGEELSTSANQALTVCQKIVPVEQDPREYKKGGGTHGPNCKIKYFNPGSHVQVADALTRLYGWKPLKLTGSKQPSTSAEVLEALDYPLVEALLEYNKSTKLLSFYEGLVGKEWVRPSYNQCATRTTRLSSSGPNIQQIPSRDPVGKQLRKAFRARPGYVLLVGDQSGFQLRILAAYLSYYFDEHRLTQCFNRGEDVHEFFAGIYGIPRKISKNVTFGYLFGAGVAKMTATANRGNPNPITEDVIRGALDTLASRMPALPQLRELFVEAAYRNGGYMWDWLGTQYTIPELNAKSKTVRASGERKVFNYIIQGMEASLFRLLQNRAIPVVHAVGGRQAFVVHDEVGYEVPARAANAVIPALNAIMSPALGDFTPPLDKADLEGLRLECEFGQGATWYDAKD